MNATTTIAALAAALLVWLVTATQLVRRAERRVTRRPLPSPAKTLGFGVAVAAAALVLRPFPQAAGCAVACTALVAAAGADYRTGYLFDAITFPAAFIVAVIAVATNATDSATWGAVLVVGAFGSVVVLSRGRLLGLGDVKAMYVLGAAFGPLESLIAIFVAAVSGIVTVAATSRLRRGTELRFGPHLAVGAAFTLVAGAPLAHRLLGA